MITNAAAVADNWARGMANSSDKFKAGVQAVTVAPTQKAAMAVDRMVAGVQRAAQEGRIQAGLARVSLEDWRQSMLGKGATRISAGAQAAKPKFQAFMQQFLPHVQAGVNALESMPRGDLETNLQRAMAMARHNATFRRSQ